ncbi:hypothetical protein [Actinomadura chibensis]|uniref:Uncharacterized protein n=2 Tax=Actinomadura chibensis TaxID=392828 RepID=A0A5D0NUG8_9ACTN|nr:hypothetical protein [Actinomadura chibensis]TYB48310.1 hypothetical protein FXF69_03615 [Actinomadura chibensis]
MRSMVYGVLGIILGIGLFVGGAASSGDDDVKCGGRTMSPGDTCTTIRGGDSTERTYDEQKSKNGREGVVMMIVGPLVALGGVVLLAGSSAGRRRRARAAYGAYGGPAPHPNAAHGHPGPHPPAPHPGHPGYPAAQPGYPSVPPAAHPAYPPPGGYPPQPPPGAYPPYHG